MRVPFTVTWKRATFQSWPFTNGFQSSSGTSSSFWVAFFAVVCGATVTVTLDNGKTYTSTIFAAEKERINRFTGHGLVNADAATRAAATHGDDD